MALERMQHLISSAGEVLGLTEDPLHTALGEKVGVINYIESYLGLACNQAVVSGSPVSSAGIGIVRMCQRSFAEHINIWNTYSVFKRMIRCLLYIF